MRIVSEMEEKENNLNNNNKTNSLKKKKLKFKSLFSLNSNSKKLNNNNISDEQTTIESVSTVRVAMTATGTTMNTIMTTATTTGNENNNNNTKMNNYNKKLNKSASSSDLNNSNNNNCTKDAIQKYSIFGTIKRNFQNKFSPNRKIINDDNFLPIPLENNDNLNNNNNSSSCNDINSNGSDIVAPLETPSAEDLKKSEEDDAVDTARMELTKYGWYWGSLSRTGAQRTLTGKPNGSFLVRNSETDRLQFTLSFRSANVTLHNRIYYVNGCWQIELQRYKSIVDLFEDTIRKSENNVFCYVKPVNRLLPPVPVRLTQPINRYFEVASLQHLCRFVLRSKFHLESFSNIQLPGKVRAYIEENFYENI